MEDFDRLKQVVAEAEAEVAKWESGNKAAGTRVRKAMMEAKKIAQAIRVKITGAKQPKEPAPAAPAAPEAPPAAPQG